jgi:hypothetical protein
VAWRTSRSRTLCGFLALLLAAGCAAPVGVERADPQSVHRELTGNVLSTGELSDFTQNVLRLGGVAERAEDDPAAALATLHEAVVSGVAGPNAIFAYAELAFKHASEGGGRPYYLASAVYAYAYLFPDGEGEAPSPFDPRYRWAVELYNLAVTKAFETAGGARVDLRAGSYELPFGRLDVAFDQGQLVWGDLRLTEFAPAAELEVRGLRNRYRRPGLGAPLAAATRAIQPIEGFQVAAKQRAPVTAVLRIDHGRRAIVQGQVHAALELYTPTDPEQITIAGRTVPLSFIVTGTAWKWFLDPGIGIERSWGFASFQFGWIKNRDLAIYCVVIAAVWQSTGFVMAMFLAGLRGIDNEIIRAAQIDGASATKLYRRIIIPQLRPAFLSAFVVLAHMAIKSYDLVIALTGGGPGRAPSCRRPSCTPTPSRATRWGSARRPR